MNRFIQISVAASIGLATPLQAFGWGSVTGPRGGTAYRGPAGGAAVQGPHGGTAARGPYGAGAAVGPNGAAAVRGPYGGAAAVGPYGGTAYRAPYAGPVYAGAVVRPWVAAPYYGSVVAGVALGTMIAATTPPPPPAPALCWFWSSPAIPRGTGITAPGRLLPGRGADVQVCFREATDSVGATDMGALRPELAETGTSAVECVT